MFRNQSIPKAPLTLYTGSFPICALQSAFSFPLSIRHKTFLSPYFGEDRHRLSRLMKRALYKQVMGSFRHLFLHVCEGRPQYSQQGLPFLFLQIREAVNDGSSVLPFTE